MANWIINDFGEIFSSGSRALTQSLGYTAGGLGVEAYAIENIGHVGIAERKGKFHVRCRPAIMADKAIASLLYWLLDRGNAQVVVSWLGDVWHMERALSCRVAITFLCHLMDQRTLPKAVHLDRLLSRQSAGAEAKWFETVRDAVSVLDDKCAADTRRTMLNNTYAGRWTLLDLDVHSRDMTVLDHGCGYPPLDPGINERRTCNFNDVSDTLYKSWVETNFFDVAVDNRPKFEDVDAVVTWPRIGDMRTRYWRANVPIKHDGTLCRMLSVSGSDSSIDLRPDLVQIRC